MDECCWCGWSPVTCLSDVTDFSQVCALEATESVGLLMQSVSVEPGHLCRTFLPALKVLTEFLVTNATAMADIVSQAVVGDPRSYTFGTDW